MTNETTNELTNAMALELSAHEMAQIVSSVYQTMLGIDSAVVDLPWFPNRERLTAAVQLSGDWNGAVTIECDPRQACLFAGRFVSMETPGAVDDIVRDVFGELANMIGGNLKSALSRGIHLSTPSVVDGGSYTMRFRAAKVRERIAFECVDGPFWVTVFSLPN